MNRQVFLHGRSKRPKRYPGARVKPIEGIKPLYYWHDGLRGRLAGDMGSSEGSQVYVIWDGYDGVKSICEWRWLQRE